MDDLGRPRRLLAVRLDNVGDVVMLSPALRGLRAAYPDATLTLLASPVGASVAPLQPWIDDVIVHAAAWQRLGGHEDGDDVRTLALIQQLRAGGFDQAWIFTSFSQSPIAPAFACMLAGIPIRVGKTGEFSGAVLTHQTPNPALGAHQVDRNLALLHGAGLPIEDRRVTLSLPGEAIAEAEGLLRELPRRPGPLVAVVPGASCAARRYDPDRFADATRDLVSRTRGRAVVLGTEKERELVERVAARAGSDAVLPLAGRTELPVFASLIARADVAISNDSAAMHLADALGTPVVVTFSGTDLESQWRPRQVPSVLLRRETDCAPCFRFECPYGLPCLDIDARDVVDAAMRLLEEVPACDVLSAS